MKMSHLVMTAKQHTALKAHLFPGDNLESAAILVCGKAGVKKQKLCVRNIILVPNHMCSVRENDRISWPGDYLEQAFDDTYGTDNSIILIHSHPGGLFDFSKCDDDSDNDVIPCIFQGSGSRANYHGSAIMTPDGKIKSRIYDKLHNSREINSIYSVWTSQTLLDTFEPLKKRLFVFHGR